MSMTKDRAIEILMTDAESASLYELAEAVDMAIKALKEHDITHCKDCVYYKTPQRYAYKEPNPYCCRSALVKMSENDFCSKAKKRGDLE